jgi:hypothetical protein
LPWVRRESTTSITSTVDTTTSSVDWPNSGLTSLGLSRRTSVRGLFGHAFCPACCLPQTEHDQRDWPCNEQNFIPTTLVSKHPRIVEASA